MDHAEIVHILQAVRNVNQLSNTSGRPLQSQVITYELTAVSVTIPLDEVVDVSVFHPLRNQREPVLGYCYSEEWQYIGMS